MSIGAAAHLVSLNSAVSNLARSRRSWEALRIFTQIQSSYRLSPDHYSLVGAFTACANLRANAAATQLHAFAVRSGLLSFRHVANSLLAVYSSTGEQEIAHQLFGEISSPDVYSRTTLLSAFARSGEVRRALQLFDQMPQGEVALWNALITGFGENGHGESALRLFRRMRQAGVETDQYAVASILSLCDSPESSDLGRQLHPVAVKAGFDMARASVVNALVTMYFNVGMIAEALDLFAEAAAVAGNEITYNAVIAGLTSWGRGEEAAWVLKEMLGSEACFRPTELTLVSILSACSSEEMGRQVHALAVRTGLDDSALVGNAAVTMYSNCGNLTDARLVFDTIMDKDLVSWNSMLSGYSQRGRHESGFEVYRGMQTAGFRPDEFTYGSLLVCSEVLDHVNTILALVNKNGLTDSTHVCNSLIVAYGKHGEVHNAYAIFCGMFLRNLISWNSVLSGCVLNGRPWMGLELFSAFMASAHCPNEYTLSIVLSTCGSISALRPGKQVHAHVVRTCSESEISLANALITMYAKCGDLDSSSGVFYGMPEKNIISWNAMLAAYAQNGDGERALSCFRDMQDLGVRPDGVTFINVLSGCSHAGLVSEARWILSSMIDQHGIEPGVDHYSCVIDLLARAGHMEEAETLIESLPQEMDSRLWWALLSSCITHGHVRLGRIAANSLLEKEPGNPAIYVLLSNLNAAAGQWEEASAMRKQMRMSGALKQPGCSWLELQG
ncbi:unnamed protein product [Spirodela intermedia]|uniref:Uncharacterized protein n=2 Tax=Spirodela intermedia TaxID=51605 RepID=A0A7I8K7T6_SPIIN|nr:unnamed protein product [Spirodela intermedia]CAA6657676.1 unnamed protein product [Spirodela intermedia]CAA7393777.1 unnamed protein product [Spirodela intermedia]